eukprot:1694955-Pleurochrysis_carterae.AAC.1
MLSRLGRRRRRRKSLSSSVREGSGKRNQARDCEGRDTVRAVKRPGEKEEHGARGLRIGGAMTGRSRVADAATGSPGGCDASCVAACATGSSSRCALAGLHGKSASSK